ncbi:MAG: hypothetical protein A4E64_00191 [Syntrophorhabdus sp. PtaU1.Bin058]|nr:MAG: hypothetical protein A4E64_00191 [Syntrophorhabdus sp. PtaU1.Bin058]
MKIEILTNVQVSEIPSVIEVEPGSTLRDVLTAIAPQIIDAETGNMKLDQDIYGVRLNDEPYGLLRNGLSTQMRDGDVIELSLIIMAGG